MNIQKEDNVIRASIPAITVDEIRQIDNNFNELANKFTEMVVKDKDLIVAQRIIQDLQAELKDGIPKSLIKEEIELIKNKPDYDFVRYRVERERSCRLFTRTFRKG